MKAIVYDGPLPDGTIGDGNGIQFTRGILVNVRDPIADELVKRGDWKYADKPVEIAKPKTTPSTKE